MSKKSKATNLKEAAALMEKLYPGEKMVDLHKVYVTKKKLSSKWYPIFNEEDDLGLQRITMEHFLNSWITGKHYQQLTGEDFLLATLIDDVDAAVFKGSELVKLLDNLKAELGPNANKSLVVVTDSSCEVVKVEEISDTALNNCVKNLRMEAAEAERHEKVKQKRTEVYAQQLKLRELVEKLGMEKAIEVLEKS